MDGREHMSIPTSTSYYIHHLSSPMPGQSPPLNILASHNSITGSAAAGPTFETDSLMLHSSVLGGGGAVGASSGEKQPVKRKRGRPRKYGTDGSTNLGLSPLPSTSSGSGSVLGSGAGTQSGGKRGRGRPPGTGRKQQLASLGEWFSGSAGVGFTPHVITIPVGEDIATKIMSFSQQGPRAVCILSANGAVSAVTLRQPATSGGTITYEGRFEILCLSGSFSINEDGDSHTRCGSLTISLSNPDGRVIGGGVGGILIAATPVQVIVGSFTYGGTKAMNKPKSGQESGLESELQMAENPISPSSAMASQSLASNPFLGGWPGSRQLDMRNIDLDLTRQLDMRNIDLDLTRG